MAAQRDCDFRDGVVPGTVPLCRIEESFAEFPIRGQKNNVSDLSYGYVIHHEPFCIERKNAG
jgi:hypothetical protein